MKYFLLTFYLLIAAPAYGQLDNVTILQILSPADMLVVSGDKVYWLKSTLTEGLADGDVIGLRGVKVVGTKKYTTVLGAARTVRVIEQELEKPKKNKNSKPLGWRVWNDNTGKYSVKATYKGHIDEFTIKLLKEDGRLIQVSLNRLDESGQRGASLYRKALEGRAKSK